MEEAAINCFTYFDFKPLIITKLFQAIKDEILPESK